MYTKEELEAEVMDRYKEVIDGEEIAGLTLIFGRALQDALKTIFLENNKYEGVSPAAIYAAAGLAFSWLVAFLNEAQQSNLRVV